MLFAPKTAEMYTQQVYAVKKSIKTDVFFHYYLSLSSANIINQYSRKGVFTGQREKTLNKSGYIQLLVVTLVRQ